MRQAHISALPADSGHGASVPRNQEEVYGLV